MRFSLLCAGVLATALIAPASGHAADFTISPSTQVSGITTVKTGTQLTFEATPAETGDSWDLDGNGAPGEQRGFVATWAYTTPGPVTITLHPPADAPVSKTIQVVGPSADFVISPAAPVVGELVSFVFSQHQAVSAIEWDLNGDGDFTDAFGPVANRTFPVPGTYAVSLRVTDLDDPPARSTSTRLIAVAPPPVTRIGSPAALRLMSPFPVVRITGKVNRRGARIRRLTVRAPDKATVAVRCRGRSCPFRRSNQVVALAGSAKSPSKTIRVKQLERRLLRAGVQIKVLVSRPGEIGKYTRFKIRRKKAPLRNDQCLIPGSTEPKECPSS